ncbi:hypothetical protein DMB66_36815 [Actinoplanes sp. ATCC 53533]|nr:hypothetical protein DMB66_36815 [Actinoplanes sp. ATCC 53533]
MASLFSLTYAAYLFSLIAGLQDCRQAWRLLMVAADGLGVGVLGIFGGLSWLVIARGDVEDAVNRFTTTIGFIVAGFVIIDLSATAHDFRVRILTPEEIPDWVGVALIVHIALAAAAFVAVAVSRRSIRPNGMRSVRAAAVSTLVCTIVGGLSMDAIMKNTGDGDAPSWINVVALLVAVVPGTVAAIIHLYALPTRGAREYILGRHSVRQFPLQAKNADSIEKGPGEPKAAGATKSRVPRRNR